MLTTLLFILIGVQINAGVLYWVTTVLYGAAWIIKKGIEYSDN